MRTNNIKLNVEFKILLYFYNLKAKYSNKVLFIYFFNVVVPLY